MMRVAGEAADGLLGADILLAFDIDLDLPNHRLTLYRARRACPRPGHPGASPISASPASPRERDRLLVPFELDGVAGLGVLDTGAQLSSISMGMARTAWVGRGGTGGGSDGDGAWRGAGPGRGADPSLPRAARSDPAVMHRPTLPVVPMTDGMGDALVGADFLRGRRVWLSYATNRVFVTPIERSAAIAAVR